MGAESMTMVYAHDQGGFSPDQYTATITLDRRRTPHVIQAAAAFSQPRTDWIAAAEERLRELLELPFGWDGHRGIAADPTVVDFTYKVLEGIMLPRVPLPSIMPLSYGGILLEWHRKSWDIEIEIAAPGNLFVNTHNLVTGDEDEFELKSDLKKLSGTIGKIAD
jgi:hypothetical protein